MKKSTIIALCLGALLLLGSPAAIAKGTPDGTKLANGMTNAAATAAVLAIMMWCGPGRPMPCMPAPAVSIPMNVCHHPTEKAKPPERNPAAPRPPGDPPIAGEQSSNPRPPIFLDSNPRRPQTGNSGSGSSGNGSGNRGGNGNGQTGGQPEGGHRN